MEALGAEGIMSPQTSGGRKQNKEPGGKPKLNRVIMGSLGPVDSLPAIRNSGRQTTEHSYNQN